MYAFPWRPQRNGEFELLDESEAAARTGGRLPRFFPTNDETVESKMGNRLHGEDLLRAITEDAGGMVGEDLGTVPDYVRPSLLSLGIPGFKVPYWEDRPDGTLIPGGEYPRLSVSTYATHDHEPLRVLWDRWMATIEAALVEPERLGQERDRAWWEVRRLAAWAGFEVPRITPFSEVHERLLEGLFRANSWAAVVMITDLFQGSQRFNLPGSVGSGNWTERLAGCISDWQTDPSRAAILARLPGLISATGRAAGAENR
jgi:4-alpha-glucanotransferase